MKVKNLCLDGMVGGRMDRVFPLFTLNADKI